MNGIEGETHEMKLKVKKTVHYLEIQMKKTTAFFFANKTNFGKNFFIKTKPMWKIF